MDDDGWVTIKGTHVLLQNGVAVGGGKLNGMTFSNAKSTKSKPKDSGANDPGFQSFKKYTYRPELGLDLDKISQVKVNKLDKKLSEDEIINKVAGLDNGEGGGSCTSLALAYVANEAGLDVLDFRGGESRNFFSNTGVAISLSLMGAKVLRVKHTDDFVATHKLLNGMELNKESILTTGEHTAVVRRTGKKSWEYLELQGHKKEENGWQKLTDESLYYRFNAQSTYMSLLLTGGEKVREPATSALIDVESLGKCAGFSELMSYINTTPGNQKKGTYGTK